MPVRKLKPRSPGSRSRTIPGFEEITKSRLSQPGFLLSFAVKMLWMKN